MKQVGILLLAMMLCSCGNLPTNAAAPVVMDKWVGRSADDLVVKYGTPSDVFMLDSGGRIFEYFESKITGTYGQSANQSRGSHLVITGYDQNGKPTGYFVGKDTSDLRARPPRTIRGTCMVLFKVAANSVIQSWSKEGEDCD